MPSPSLSIQALDNATERVKFLTAESDRLALALCALGDEIVACHAALRAATVTLRELQDTADVPTLAID